ncbi:MAG: TraB/GumN family protein [Caldimonas sp.]
MTLLQRFACALGRARQTLAGAPLAALAALAAGLPLAAAHAAGEPALASCPPAPVPITAERVSVGLAEAKDHGFLWRLSKDGRVSYLYGTIHAARSDWMFPGPTLLDAIRQTDTLALELDVLDPDVQRRLAAAIVPRRKEPLPAALAERIDRQLKAECLDLEAWSKFAPEFQVASLGVMAARRDGLDPSNAIDLVLAIVARDMGKPVASLETPEMQMQALQMPTEAETIEFVQSGLDDLESGRARPMLNRIARVWVAGDYAELSRYERWCDCVHTAADRAAMKRLLDDRNPGLAAAIDTLHGSGRQVFAAVGSLHMIGPNGLPLLLRQRGYKVEQGDFAR